MIFKEVLEVAVNNVYNVLLNGCVKGPFLMESVISHRLFFIVVMIVFS